MRGISLVKTTSEKAGYSFHGYMFILAQYLYYIQWTLKTTYCTGYEGNTMIPKYLFFINK